jgi:integrase
MANVAAAVNAAQLGFEFPCAPLFFPRALPVIAPAGGYYRPEILRKSKGSEVKFRAGIDEEQYLHEDTLFRSRRYMRLARQWLSVPANKGWPDVALSLVVEDGICLEEELRAFLKELFCGKIYHHGDLFFCDVMCPFLGLRRVRLSMITMELLNRCPKSNEHDIDQILEEAADALASFAAAKSYDVEAFMYDAQAFLALRVPGFERVWYLGKQFSRVTRPESVARHVTGFAEELQVSTYVAHATRVESLRESELDKLVSKAVQDRRDESASHDVLRNTLVAELAKLADNFESPHEEMLANFLRYLCDQELAVTTIRGYWPIARALADVLDTSGVLRSNARYSESYEAVRDFLVGCVSEETPDPRTAVIASTNHLLKFLKIALRAETVFDPAVVARQYADFPSYAEISLAVQLARSDANATIREREDAAIALLLIREFSLRRNELIHLRMCDLRFDGGVWLSICRAASGAVKSANAERVQRSSCVELEVALKTRVEVMRSLNLDKRCYLFSFGGDPLRSKDERHLLKRVTTYLQAATGSIGIGIHRARARIVTTGILSWMDCNLDALSMRQAPTALAIRSGHGHFKTTMLNYAHDLDQVRRARWDKLNAEEGLLPSKSFIAAMRVSGAKLNRQADAEEMYPNLAAQLVPLSSLVREQFGASGIPQPSNTRSLPAERLVRCAFHRIVGHCAATASLKSNTNQRESKRIDKALRSRPFVQCTTPPISEARIAAALDSDAFKKASANLVSAEELEVLKLRGYLTIENYDQPWQLRCCDDVGGLTELVQLLAHARISTLVSLRKGSSLDVGEDIKFLKSLGVVQVETSDNRYFRRHKDATVEFFAAGTKGKSRQKSRRISMFIASACLLATLSQSQGEPRAR